VPLITIIEAAYCWGKGTFQSYSGRINQIYLFLKLVPQKLHLSWDSTAFFFFLTTEGVAFVRFHGEFFGENKKKSFLRNSIDPQEPSFGLEFIL
jgi:hypothetical protein